MNGKSTRPTLNLLQSRIQLNVKNNFSAKVKLSCYLEDEMELFAELKKNYNELVLGEVYPSPKKSNVPAFVCFVSLKSCKGLSTPLLGKGQIAAHLGSQITQVIQAKKHLSGFKSVELEISKNVTQKIENFHHMFFAAMMQRSVTIKSSISEKKNDQVTTVDVRSISAEKDSVTLSEQINWSMNLAKTLINLPPNLLNPSLYEAYVSDLLKHPCLENIRKLISVDILNDDKLDKMGCQLIRAVGKGSEHKPRIIVLEYNGAKNKDAPFVTLVGKGITFDSGGLDIKGSSFMRNMKKDMGGSAAAIGTFISLVLAKPQARVKCYLSVAENMVSDKSMRPGDVYSSRAGITVEIDNTDAEGRLVLADALTLASEEKPDWIIDFATLTGAARVALGTQVDAMFSNSRSLSEMVFNRGVDLGDWIWPMPMVESYESMLDSSLADCANSSASGHGGAITAALFMKKFIQNNVPWTHLDTYMWTDKASDWNAEAGPAAKCVVLMHHSVMDFIQNKHSVSAKRK